MEVTIPSNSSVIVAKINISAHCRDCCSVTLITNNGYIVMEYDGYVPDIFPNSFGDSLDLQIDVDTGKILNWDLTKEKLQEFIDKNLE